jgi:glucose/arabinose dehydrogenase
MKTPCLLTFLLSLFISSQSLAQQPEIVLDTFASGFNQVTDITNAGDSRLFIVEQPGLIKILKMDGTTLDTPFLDIRSSVNTGGNERGLLGLTFHPDYESNGYFYVNYTAEPDGATHISRFSVSQADSNIADPTSELVLLTQMQPFTNHNAGDLEFGPDNYLYFGLGDGGAGGDRLEAGQDSMTLLGKMLRIDVDNGSLYAIPPDNPFVNDANALDEIWAIGLRNPWRFSFDSETGDLWIADVGQNQYEEIDLEPAGSPGGLNWGWDCYEGNQVFEPENCGPASDYDFPVFEYAHAGIHCSVTGGFVYRGSQYPDLEGHYVFADLCSGQFWTLYQEGAGGYDTTDQGQLVEGAVTTFGLDQDNEMYVAERSNYIFKITTNYSTASNNPRTKDGIELQVSPNPVSNIANITYELPANTNVHLAVFDTNGRQVDKLINKKQNAGPHRIKWECNRANTGGVTEGIYFIVLKTKDSQNHRKVIIMD